MAEKKKMSVAEIMAAARKADSKGGSAASTPEAAPPEEPTAPAAEAAPAAVTPVEEAPAPAAPKPKPAAAGGARPSVAEIMKMAREGKAAKPAAAAAPKPAPKPAAAAAKPATKPAAGKTDGAAAKGAKPVAAGAKSTASILAAARAQHKPGPMTKSEAAAKLKPEPEAKKAKPAVPPMPPKPEYAKPKPTAAAEGDDRRFFLGFALGSFMGMGFTSLTATVGLWTLGTARFMFPNVLIEPPSKFKVGFPSDFAPGMVEEKFKAQFGVWVVKAEYQGQLQIYALKSVCTHLGCTPNWLEGEQKFKCPCHGSGFYKDGINFEGPAPRPLERYAIHMADDGQLEIDKSKTFQEEMGQWKDAACFVPV